MRKLFIVLLCALSSGAYAGCFGKAATIRPTLNDWKEQANDGYLVNGTAKPDVIVSGWFNDNLYGRAGDDRLCGTRGRDFLSGGPGVDKCSGGPGKDIFTGCELVIE